MFVPPMMDEGTEMLPGVDGAVLVETAPSSDTKREEGRIKAGRMPRELEQLVSPLVPAEPTASARLEVMLQPGERSHQPTAEPLR